jgi:hypothetical protein
MKTVNLTRIGDSGIYTLPAGVTIRDVLNISLDDKPIGFNRYKVLAPDQIDIYDSNLSNSAETVTAEVE